MSDTRVCEYCDQPIEDKGYRLVLRGQSHYFCRWHCYILYRFRVPKVNPESIYDPSVGVLKEWNHGRIRSSWERNIKPED